MLDMSVITNMVIGVSIVIGALMVYLIIQIYQGYYESDE